MTVMIVLAFVLPLIIAVGAHFSTRSVVKETEAAKSRVAKLRGRIKENRQKLMNSQREKSSMDTIWEQMSKDFVPPPSFAERMGSGVAVPNEPFPGGTNLFFDDICSNVMIGSNHPSQPKRPVILVVTPDGKSGASVVRGQIVGAKLA
jgi:hypothetical protein